MISESSITMILGDDWEAGVQTTLTLRTCAVGIPGRGIEIPVATVGSGRRSTGS